MREEANKAGFENHFDYTPEGAESLPDIAQRAGVFVEVHISLWWQQVSSVFI